MPTATDAVWAPLILSLLRIVAALLFIEHGTVKLFGFPHIEGFAGPPLVSLLGLAAIIETVGGLLLLLGLFTRITAFVLAGEMAVAYFMAHAPRGFFPILNGGEGAILFCWIFLYLAAAGGGAWSLDRARAA